MATEYKFDIPTTRDVSSTTIIGKETPMESAEANALWYYNRVRAHDGFPPLHKLPRGTKRTPVLDRDT